MEELEHITQFVFEHSNKNFECKDISSDLVSWLLGTPDSLEYLNLNMIQKHLKKDYKTENVLLTLTLLSYMPEPLLYENYCYWADDNYSKQYDLEFTDFLKAKKRGYLVNPENGIVDKGFEKKIEVYYSNIELKNSSEFNRIKIVNG